MYSENEGGGEVLSPQIKIKKELVKNGNKRIERAR